MCACVNFIVINGNAPQKGCQMCNNLVIIPSTVSNFIVTSQLLDLMIQVFSISNNGWTIVVMPTQLLICIQCQRRGKNRRCPDIQQLLSCLFAFKRSLKFVKYSHLPKCQIQSLNGDFIRKF